MEWTKIYNGLESQALPRARTLAARYGGAVTPQASSVYYDLEFTDPAMSYYTLRGANLGLIVERLQYIEQATAQEVQA